MSEAGPVVCGFADEATQLAGLAWTLPGERGVQLARNGEITTGDAAIADLDEGVRMKLEAGELSCEAELTPRSAEAPLSAVDGEALPGEPSSAICSARVVISDAGDERTTDCVGHLTRWRASPTEDAELVRHLTIPAPEGALLVLAARREPGGSGHDAEQARAWLLDAEGRVSAFGEALLSTQYDASGRQTRASLELWPAETDAPPFRAAGAVLGDQIANGAQVTAALLHSSAEGTAGLGSYLIWRA